MKHGVADGLGGKRRRCSGLIRFIEVTGEQFPVRKFLLQEEVDFMLGVWRNILMWTGWFLAAGAWLTVFWSHDHDRRPVDGIAPSIVERELQSHEQPSVSPVDTADLKIVDDVVRDKAVNRRHQNDENDAELPGDIEQETYLKYQEIFESETNFSTEAAVAGEHLWNFFGQFAEQNVQVNELECRSVVCRVVVQLPDFDTDVYVFGQISGSPDSALGKYNFVIPTRTHFDDGSIEAIMFVEL